MGCGKSKHDVASGNTVLQSKKSSVSSKAGPENGTEAKDTNNNNNVDNVSSGLQVEQKESESVKEFGVEGKDDDEVANDVKGEAEKTNVQEEKEAEPEGGEGNTQETVAAEGQSESEKSEGGKDDSLEENEQKINDADTAAAAGEKMPAEHEEGVERINLREDVSVKEEDIKDTNVSTTEGEEKDLKAEEGQ
ncbi:hypothetical protein E2542_SST00737 [Spatholobus suberectus]|nr:hypothetical protein E2542_SST00737 [Spatholobus suberectus]